MSFIKRKCLLSLWLWSQVQEWVAPIFWILINTIEDRDLQWTDGWEAEKETGTERGKGLGLFKLYQRVSHENYLSREYPQSLKDLPKGLPPKYTHEPRLHPLR